MTRSYDGHFMRRMAITMGTKDRTRRYENEEHSQTGGDSCGGAEVIPEIASCSTTVYKGSEICVSTSLFLHLYHTLMCGNIVHVS